MCGSFTMFWQTLTVSILTVLCVVAQGPPGVPPRQAAPPQQQQQFQQQPQHHQQHQQQQQFQQQQFQQQQLNVQEGHAHGDHHGDGRQLKFQSEIHNADHIMEHLQNVIKTKPKDQMTEEELEFHYFKMHDYDNNNKLDGVEIGKALTHFHDDEDQEKKEGAASNQAPPPPPSQVSPPPPGDGSVTGSSVDNSEPVISGEEGTSTTTVKPALKTPVYSDEILASLIETVLKTYDKNEDGLVDYAEYKMYKDALEKEHKVPDKKTTG